MSGGSDDRGAAFVRAGLLGLFLVSGTCGLVHEVAWTRLLRRVLGNGTDAITIVLCVFMGGLAIGSFLFGRALLRRRAPLLVFAGLEGVVGLYCLALPALVAAGSPLYGAWYQGSTSDVGFTVARLSFAALVLAVPALLMGGTLPVLSRFVASAGVGLGRTAGTLYATNTFGAVLGASLGAFLFVPAFGVTGAIRFAAGLNLLVAALAVVLHRRAAVVATGEPDRPAAAATPAADAAGAGPSRARPVVLIGYGVSGAAALVYEIGWTRALSLLVGSSVYAFGLMLTAFVLGLA
ncbi:MAG: spermidine synthase, partial [Planctomycetota bacterium JB042]